MTMSTRSDASREVEDDGYLELLTKTHDTIISAGEDLDDRVGRLLTGVAFLTAAVLALAALNSTEFATRRYDLAPYHVPLALAIVLVFLVAVIFSVILLVSAMVGPLGLPGVSESARKYENKKDPDFVRRASQLHYEEIADLGMAEWSDKWDEPLVQIRRWRRESILRDIHDLCVKISFKHDRNAEAVSVLIYSLLAFAGSVFVVSLAAYHKDDKGLIHLTYWSRIALAVIFGIYFVLELELPNRLEQQEIVESESRPLQISAALKLAEPTVGRTPIPVVEEGEYAPRLYERRRRDLFSFCIFALVACVMVYASDWPAWYFVGPEIVLVIVAISVYILMVRAAKQDPRRWIVVSSLILVFFAGAVVSQFQGWYFGQFLCVWVASLSLLAIALLRPTMALSRKRKDRSERASKAEQREADFRNAVAASLSSADDGRFVSSPVGEWVTSEADFIEARVVTGVSAANVATAINVLVISKRVDYSGPLSFRHVDDIKATIDRLDRPQWSGFLVVANGEEDSGDSGQLLTGVAKPAYIVRWNIGDSPQVLKSAIISLAQGTAEPYEPRSRVQLVDDARLALREGEELLDVTGGVVAGGDQGRRDTLVVTDRRVVLRMRSVGGYDSQDFAYGLLGGCDYVSGPGFSTIELIIAGERVQVTQVVREEAERLVPIIRERLARALVG